MALALIAAVAILAFNLGGYPLIEPDEGRNAEVAREMAETNNYVLPHLNGLPYLDKPVVFFAATAAIFEVLETDEFAARLSPFLFGVATALLVGWFAARRIDAEAGWVAAMATLTAPLMVGLSRAVIMDTATSFCVVLALISFFQATDIRAQNRERRSSGPSWLRWTLLAWGAMALGVLTKGPVALAVPLLVAAPYAVWRRASRAVWHPLGLVVLVVIVAPWVWAVSQEIPNFLHYVVVTETWARMTSDELKRTEPLWFFLPVILAGSFPWWILAAAGARSRARDLKSQRDPARVYLWLWLVVPLVFFSLSRGKQEQYVLPLVPAIALLVATAWSDRPRGVRAAAVCWGIFGAILIGVALYGLPGLDPDRVPVDVAIRAAAGIGIVALAGGVVAWFAMPSRRRLAVFGLSLPLVGIPVAAAPVLEAVAESRSARGLARAVAPHIGPETELLWVESYAAGLSFYLRRTIPVASADGDEFRSNYILRNSELFLDDAGLLRPLASAESAVEECRGDQIFLLGTGSRDLGDVIEASGIEQLAENRRWMAFGPDCVSDVEISSSADPDEIEGVD
jgi:4-amino-4-deoxy-L-arabinose transferase-like glycosyltransferase